MITGFKKLIQGKILKQNYVSPLTKNLKGQVIVITGASRGIGKAIAEVLEKEGASLVLIARDLPEFKNSFTKFDRQSTLLLKGDVSSLKDVSQMIKKIYTKFDKIDVLINNAGLFLGKPLEETSIFEFQSIVDVNLRGVFQMSAAVIPVMKKQKSGFIINIGSKISHNTNVAPNMTLYAMTKYAVEGFSYALSKELKPFGIRVTCLMPGTVNTFFSLKAREFLSPYALGLLVSMLIKFEDIDFEGIVFKSKRQNI